jgi:hypothetical protein
LHIARLETGFAFGKPVVGQAVNFLVVHPVDGGGDEDEQNEQNYAPE